MRPNLTDRDDAGDVGTVEADPPSVRNGQGDGGEHVDDAEGEQKRTHLNMIILFIADIRVAETDT